MNFMRRKMIKCRGCGKKYPKKKCWDVEMKTGEGYHKVSLCINCAYVLEHLRKDLVEMGDEVKDGMNE